MKKLLIILLFSSYLFPQTWTRVNFAADGTQPYSWNADISERGDTVLVDYAGSTSALFRIMKLKGSAYSNPTNYQNNTYHQVGGGAYRLGTGYYSAGGTSAGTNYEILYRNSGNTMSTINNNIGFSVYAVENNSNYDTVYYGDNITLKKSADNTNFYAASRTVRAALGDAAGCYIQSLFYNNDTLWIGLTYGTFLYNTLPGIDTAHVLYYTPSNGQIYVDKRNLTGQKDVRWFRGFTYYKDNLYALTDGESDGGKGLWKRNSVGNWSKVDLPMDSTANLYMVSITGDGDKLMYIGVGRTWQDDVNNAVWECRNGIWTKLNPLYGTGAYSAIAFTPQILKFNGTQDLYAFTGIRMSKRGNVVSADTNLYSYAQTNAYYMQTEPSPFITLTYPTEGEAFKGTDILNVTWTSGSINTFYVYFREHPASDWVLLGDTTGNGYDWAIPDTMTTTDAQIKVTNGADISSTSDEFAVISTTYRSIEILYPCNASVNSGSGINLIFRSVNISSIIAYYGSDTTNWNLIDTMSVSGYEDGIFDTTIYSWTVPSFAGNLWIKAIRNIDTTKYFTPQTTYYDREVRAPLQAGYQNPVWWSPVFQVNGEDLTISVKCVAFGYFGLSYGYLYKYGTSEWENLSSTGFPIYVNTGSKEMPYPNGVPYWYQGTYGDSIFSVTDDDFMVTNNIGTNLIWFGNQTTSGEFSDLLIKMGGTSSLSYSDTLTYLYRKYWYNSTDTSLYTKDLTNDITQKFASLTSLCGTSKLKYGYIKIYRIDDQIFVTNSSRQQNAVNYSYNVFPVNDGTIVEDKCVNFSIITRNYFRGIYPKAILQVIPREGH